MPLQPGNPANQFALPSVGISHLDSGFRRADDEVTQAVYRISQIHTISPAELVRETENDHKLEFVRQALLSKQLGRLPEPYRNNLSTQYGLLFHDDRVIILAGLQSTFVKLLHRDYAGVERMKDIAS